MNDVRQQAAANVGRRADAAPAKLSQAKTVETMVKNFKSLLINNEEVINDKNTQEKQICKR